jgi:predicted permease
MLGNATVYVTTLLRLAVLPVAVHFTMRFLGFEPFVVNINTLVIAMPVATYGTILCLKYEKDTTMITAVTFVTTLVSMVSIPLLVTLLF